MSHRDQQETGARGENWVRKKRRGALVTVRSYLGGQHGEDGAGFLKLCRDRMRRRGNELGHRRVKDDIEKSFFSVDVQYGNRGPEGPLASPFLEMLQT